MYFISIFLINIIVINKAFDKKKGPTTIVYRNSSEKDFVYILIVHHEPLKAGCLII